MHLKRRDFMVSSLLASAALGTGAAFRPAHAAGRVTAAIYPGAWDEAFRSIVAPALMDAHGIQLDLDPLYAVDQIAKARAARGLAPFDVFVLDPGPAATGEEMGLFAPFEVAKLSNADKLPSAFVGTYGVPVAAQVVGIAYNPSKLPTPTSWADLFEEPFVSRLGLTGFQTTFGTASLIEIAKTFGGSETDVEPAFEKIREALPKVAAVAQPQAMVGLFQQGEIDVMYGNTQAVATLQGRGVDIAFAKPASGAIAFVTTMHVAKDAEFPDEAYKYIDTVVSADVQTQLMQPPNNFIPVNADVDLLPSLPMAALAEIETFVRHDWSVINPQRPGWIERFNREVQA